MSRQIQSNFGQALRHVRKAKSLTQEDFEGPSSRIHISALERGVRQPTLGKVDELAAVMKVHPLSLLALSYCKHLTADEVRRLCDKVVQEVGSLGV
jgi:transcriptional regulator with XRE-family HTH domain